MEPLRLTVADPRDPIAREPAVEAGALRQVAKRAAEYVVSSTQLDRTDRIWPADFTVFLTNPLNVAYGAGGTAVFVHRTLGGLPEEGERWIMGCELDVLRYPPGLYTGLAGIALCFAEIGHVERGVEVMDLLSRSPLLRADPSLFQGMAGWGLAALDLYLQTGVPRLLDQACTAADALIASARPGEEGGRFWVAEGEEAVHLGLAYGASGVGLFFLRLYQVTGDERHRAAAVDAMEFEIAHAREIGSTVRWGAAAEDVMTEPYWLHGTSGVGSALARFHAVLGDERYRVLAERAADGAFSIFTVEPNQFRGLSGIGEFMLDLYTVTGSPVYLRRARRIAESVLCYQVERPAGIAFPGRFLLRITTDYGTGSAGVGLFLQRLAALGGARFLHDPPQRTVAAEPGLIVPAPAAEPALARAEAEPAGVALAV